MFVNVSKLLNVIVEALGKLMYSMTRDSFVGDCVDEFGVWGWVDG